MLWLTLVGILSSTGAQVQPILSNLEVSTPESTPFNPSKRRTEFIKRMEIAADTMGNASVFKVMFASKVVTEKEDIAVVVFLYDGDVISFVFLYDGEWKSLPEVFREVTSL